MKTKISWQILFDKNYYLFKFFHLRFFILLLPVFFSLSSLKINSQVTQQWVAIYDGPSNSTDIANALAVDASGNVYVTGLSLGTNATYYDCATVKYNSSGVQQWVERYDGPKHDMDAGFAIAVDDSGNVYVAGYSTGIGTDKDFTTIKYNSSGIQQWVNRYSSAGNIGDAANTIAVDRLGNVYAAGSANYDYLTIKYNSSGVQQWLRTYNGPGNGQDYINAIKFDVAGNVYITGTSAGGATSYDFATIKYNSSGVLQWINRYDGPASQADFANSIAVDANGNVYVTGESAGIGTNLDYATVKYNSSGVQQWVSRYDGAAHNGDESSSIAIDALGNVYITGASTNNINGTLDYATIKYNSSGVQQWVSIYDGPGHGDDDATAIAVDSHGNVYITGDSYGGGSNYQDYATVKYNTFGVQQWVERYNGAGNNSGDYANALVIDTMGNVYVTGASDGLSQIPDYVTIKYSQPIGIQKISTEIPKQFSLSQNYPNPFNPSTKIRFEVPLTKGDLGGFVKLTIYDALGKEVTTLVNEHLKPGTYSVDWNAADYPSGVYFYKLVVSEANPSQYDFTDTKKMVLIK